MKIEGVNVDFTSCIGQDWIYFLDLADKHNLVHCPRDLVLDFCRVNNFITFIVSDKSGKKLGTVFSNYLETQEYTVDLYVDEGNAGYIPECFDMFVEFMAQFTDRLYGYTLIGDEKMLKLGKLFGFEKLDEREGYVITVREI